MTEFGLIDLLRHRFADIPNQGFEGIGDDCAIYPINAEESLVISCDTLCEDIHFLGNKISAEELARKSLTVNLSDVAAMGAQPIASMLALSLPSSCSEEWVKEFIEGYHALSFQYGVPLIGGDTTASNGGISLTVTIFGRIATANIKRRSAAVAGDIIMVTGELGVSAMGLEDILSGNSSTSAAHCHLNPPVQVEEGVWLGKQASVHAMMDISDGLASDIRHILNASCKSAIIDIDNIPVYGSIEKALCGGEDYRLLFTVDADDAERLTSHFEQQFGYRPYCIGTITESQPASIEWREGGHRIEKSFEGFTHF